MSKTITKSADRQTQAIPAGQEHKRKPAPVEKPFNGPFSDEEDSDFESDVRPIVEDEADEALDDNFDVEQADV